MRGFIEKIKRQPESVRKRIFIAIMAVFFVVVCVLYVFSIKKSITYSLNEKTAQGESLPGEFHLPGITQSVGGSVKDLWNAITKGVK